MDVPMMDDSAVLLPGVTRAALGSLWWHPLLRMQSPADLGS